MEKILLGIFTVLELMKLSFHSSCHCVRHDSKKETRNTRNVQSQSTRIGGISGRDGSRPQAATGGAVNIGGVNAT